MKVKTIEKKEGSSNKETPSHKVDGELKIFKTRHEIKEATSDDQTSPARSSIKATTGKARSLSPKKSLAPSGEKNDKTSAASCLFRKLHSLNAAATHTKSPTSVQSIL